jgi:hypothetical protein
MNGVKAKPRPSRAWRLVQFSLRGLLVLVAVCAVWLGIAFHRAREQARAVATINSSGGYVFYDFQGVEFRSFDQWGTSEFPTWLLDQLGVDFFHDVTLVVIDVVPATDDILATLAQLPEVRYLAFFSARVTDQGLAHLQSLNKLQLLSIQAREDNAPHLEDAAFSVLAKLPDLRDLEIQGENLSDHGLDYLNGLAKLERLILVDTQVTRAGAEALSKSRPACNISVSRGVDQIFSAGPDVSISN